ncbi:Abscission/NoCut checkpoint regulator, partial [Tolypocladium capitatum]
MPDDIDRSLLDRLQALRSSSATPERPAPTLVKIDVIERARTPTREEALAARLRSLREHGASPSSTPAKDSPEADERNPQGAQRQPPAGNNARAAVREEPGDDAVDAVFETDDQTLEELLVDVDAAEEQTAPREPREDEIRALLEQLSRSVPKDDETGADEGRSDDSDGEQMSREVDDVLSQFRDEAEVDAALGQINPPREDERGRGHQATDKAAIDDLPSLPPGLDDLPSTSPSHPPG